MSELHRIDAQDENGTYLEGPLIGQTSVTVLIGASETIWLNHATEAVGYSFSELVRIAAEEAALNHARDNNLLAKPRNRKPKF